jgi:hypothetical protein
VKTESAKVAPKASPTQRLPGLKGRTVGAYGRLSHRVSMFGHWRGSVQAVWFSVPIQPPIAVWSAEYP